MISKPPAKVSRRHRGRDTSEEVGLRMPDGYDAVQAAPASHRVVFENAFIRVVHVTLPLPAHPSPCTLTVGLHSRAVPTLVPRLTRSCMHNNLMPMVDTPKRGMPSGALPMLILRVLQSGSLHGYALAQRIHVLSSEVLAVEEGLLYPTLQKMLLKGWVTAEWGISETNRKVRFYRLTPEGRKHLKAELSEYDRVTQAIQSILRTA
jgi:PadR family transcriptional regulator, regulatory protein PadR